MASRPCVPPVHSEGPKRTYRAIQRVLVSIRRLHASKAWHRAPLLAEEELGTHKAEGCRRTPPPAAVRRGCGSYPTNPERQNSDGVAVTIGRKADRQVIAARRGKLLVVVRTPGGSEQIQRAKSPVPSQEVPLATEGRQSGRARNPIGQAPSVSTCQRCLVARYLSTLFEGEGLVVPGSRRSDPYRTHGKAPKPPE